MKRENKEKKQAGKRKRDVYKEECHLTKVKKSGKEGAFETISSSKVIINY